ncbi:cellulase family glycosylhydrolase [Opitutus terrae]|uniref:Glycoside hydrolase family 5 n=1 Tax=Opitutus terrae (strain DSM 11246 / JCM 15787 / PB90-1) TaxID=452637 RepID=B1ZMF7_OPITP|nr:cellulase family glycosylhydrolase [Opitutus terrae]ACB73410.1 glycoside hydrolase family 5 [Opitutus terrae PB90-1]
MNRREFLKSSAAAAAGVLLSSRVSAAEAARRSQPRIPRWRGFNLTELASGRRGQAFVESDFAWMAEWGFDFARLPMSYWSWSSANDWMKIEEDALAPVDQAIEWAARYGIHVNLNFHRIPGYCVNGREREPFQLFDSPHDAMARALEAAVHHWRTFAQRYRDIPSSRLSFDLFNEPPFMADHDRYVEVARALVGAIREVSPDRLIFADGADIGQTPVPGLVELGLVQSTRGYLPKMVSHYTATWVPKNEFESFETPTWPMVAANGERWDRERLRRELIDKWQPLVAQGVPVHVGEWGCFIKTPHAVALRWMTDLLSLWKEAGWGWAMWNLRGGFGIVDSGRADVKYESFHGHQLDRAMLELLLAH